MYEDEIFDEDNYEEEEWVDYIGCPSCGSAVAKMQHDYVYGQVAHCIYDCGFKWYMLIEPDPCTFHDPDTLHNMIKGHEDDTLGNRSKIVLFEGDLEEVYHEDPSRHARILKFSDFNNTNLKNGSFLADEDVPNDLTKRRRKFFEDFGESEAENQEDENGKKLGEFLDGKDDLENILYIFANVCGMTIHKDETPDPFADAMDDPELIEAIYARRMPRAITYNEYQKHDLMMLSRGEIKGDAFIEQIKEHLMQNYSLPFIYTKADPKIDDGCRPQKGIFKEIQDDFVAGVNNQIHTIANHPSLKDKPELHSSMMAMGKLLDVLYDGKKEKAALSGDHFYNIKTKYNDCTIGQLHEELKFAHPISSPSMKPYIISLEDFYKDLEFNTSIPSLIDFDNEIAFMSVSHRATIDKLSELKEGNSDITELNNEKADIYFHKRNNAVQIFVSMMDKSNRVLTFQDENENTQELIEKLNEQDIKHTTSFTLARSKMTVLNGSGNVTGEIYYPKPDEENIPEGKILVIPTASEDYFLPAVSNMKYNGCIITEKGSKTAHLIINAKEFEINIILVKDALSMFKEGERVSIDLDAESIKRGV